MKLQLVCMVLGLCLIDSYEAQWAADAKISTGSKGPKIDLGLSHTVGKFSFRGGGWSDFKGGWGVGLGVKMKFKKRSAGMKKRFHLHIEVDPRDFRVYDNNSDGIISLEEMKAVFSNDKMLAMELFQALNVVPDDGGITKEDWEIRSSQLIAGWDR